jgi:hypothetical protein
LYYAKNEMKIWDMDTHIYMYDRRSGQWS